MELRQVFNVFLLGLILTTIVTTLVVYLVFKFRQGIQVIRQKDIELEGEFFVRHAPHLEKKYQQEVEALLESKNSSLLGKYRTQWIIGGTFVLILGFLSMENYLNFRKTLINRQTTADEYLDLIKGGLLKKYPYLPTKITQKPLDSKLFTMSSYESYLLNGKLKKMKIGIVSNQRNLSLAFSFHKKSLGLWSSFCERRALDCSKANFLNLSNFDFVIVPAVEAMSGRERQLLTRFLASGRPALLTGAVGVYNGLGKKNKEGWYLKQSSELELLSVKSKTSSHPSLVRFPANSFYDLPSDLILNWIPTNEKFFVKGEKVGSGGLVAADFNGAEFTEDGKYELRFISISDSINWINMDPLINDNSNFISKASSHYSDMFLIQTIAKLSSNLKIKMKKWPLSYRASGLLSVNATDQFLKANMMIKNLNKSGLSHTLFVQADLFENFYQDLSKDSLESGFTELSLLNYDNTDFNNSSFKEVFDRVESGRLLVERKHKRIINGIYPPNELIDKNVFSAAVQNGMHYILGRFEGVSSEPLFFEEHNISLFPRGGFLDSELLDLPELVRPKDLKSILNEKIEASKYSEGVYSLYFHTKIFGDDNFKPFFLKALQLAEDDKEIWWTNYTDLVDWNESRRHVSFSQPKEDVFEVYNENLVSVKNLTLFSSHDLTGDRVSSRKIANGYYIFLPEIDSGKKLRLFKNP